MTLLESASPRQDEELFEAWWVNEGQFLRSGGGEYEKTFAYHAFKASKSISNTLKSVPLTDKQVMTSVDAWFRGGVNYSIPDEEGLEKHFVLRMRAAFEASGIITS